MRRVIRQKKIKMKDSLKFNNWIEIISLIDLDLIKEIRMNMMMVGMLMRMMIMMILICFKKKIIRMSLKLMSKKRQKHKMMIKT